MNNKMTPQFRTMQRLPLPEFNSRCIVVAKDNRAEDFMDSPYDQLPQCVLKRITEEDLKAESYCAGFELKKWWCDGLADNLLDWIIDYALKSDELRTTNHTNSYIRLRQAASRVYTSPKYEKRGEVGEIAAHAICRKYFGTIPIAARVNYLSASNDPVKAFDLVHVRYLDGDDIELWLGEAKFFKDRSDAIADAIISIKSHITKGFLKNEKLLLGPQVSKDIPHSESIKKLLSSEVSLDELFAHAIFPVLIAANSDATRSHESVTKDYTREIYEEMGALWKKLAKSGLTEQIRLRLIYVPLGDKDELNRAFDARLKGLQVESSKT